MIAPEVPLAERVLAGVRWIAVLRTAAQILSWVSTLVVVRWISPGDYGLNAMLEAPLEMTLMLAALGVDSALVQAPRLLPRDLQSAFGLILIASGLLFVGWFFGGGWLAEWFAEPQLEPLCRALSGLFLLVPLRAIPNALLDRDLNFRTRAKIELIAAIVAALGTLGLAFAGVGIWALVAGIMLNRTVCTLLMMLAQPWRLWPRLGAEAWPLLAFGGVMLLSSAVTLLIGKLPALMAGPALGAQALGLYAVALQFAGMPIAKAMPVVNPVLFPAFARLSAQPVEARHYFLRAIELSSLLIFPLMVGLAVVATEFVALVLGPGWEAAALPLALLSLAMPPKLINTLFKPVIVAMGRPQLVLIGNGLTLLLLALVVMLATPYGVPGLAVAVGVLEPLALVVTLWLARPVLTLGVGALLRALRPATVGVVLMAGAVWSLKDFVAPLPLAARAALEVLWGAAVYAGAVHFFFREVSARARRLLSGAGSG